MIRRINDLQEYLPASLREPILEADQDICIHHLVEAQVARTPDAIAIVFEDIRLTYNELNRRANQLGHRLRRMGVGRDVLVGICLERSIDLVVGVLAVLKAGGVCVPLDPTYPNQRLVFMITDARISVLLTRDHLSVMTPSQEVQVICLDSEWKNIAHEREENPDSGVTAQNLAYIIYTSGSTGRPKGVAMPHAPLFNLIAWQLQNFALPSKGKTLQFAPLNFDVSFQEIFSSWCSGGTLVLIGESARRDTVGLLRFLLHEGVERLFLPFVALQQLAEIATSNRVIPSSLCEIITAGEQLRTTSQIVSLFEELKDCRLHNQYGPSESHVVTAYTLTGSPNTWPVLPPIGRPIANTQVYVLDAGQRPVPIGVPGELYIGGVGLARGYLNRPDLTAERFVPNPFARVEDGGWRMEDGRSPSSILHPPSSGRLYKTGDLARYLGDGKLEFLGRLDEQVKIRGYRIELGEIESVVGQHPAVRDAVVLAREDTPGNKRLVAYIVPTGDQRPTTNEDPDPPFVEAQYIVPLRRSSFVGELRAFLKQKLPEYMIPSAFVLLAGLPVTPSGKVDRRALPAPDTARPNLEEAFVAARTPIEELLAGISSELLGLADVGVHDNFFELGGHSLLATQFISRIRDAFHVELSLHTFFETPTIADLAGSIETARSAKQGLHMPSIALVSIGEEIPLSFAQERLWFLDQLVPDNPFYNMPLTVKLEGPLNVHVLAQTFNEVVRRHEILRTSFHVVHERPVQVVSPAQPLPLEVIDVRQLSQIEQQAEALQLVTIETQQPFDLTQSPLLRVKVLRFDQQDHLLILTMHHIVADGWSIEILLREISALYTAFSDGIASPLPELSIQYADFACWQREWLQGETLEALRAYWRQQLIEAPPLLRLPTDRRRPPVQSFRGARHASVLPRSLKDALKQLGQQEACTLFMTLLAAFKALLYRYTGQTDIVVGTPIASRNRTELEPLIGFFVNSLVLRTDLRDRCSFQSLLQTVRDVCLDAYEHQDLPFEKLVEIVQPERNLSYNPICQVMLVFQNSPMTLLSLPNLIVNALEIDTIDTGAAKLDLSLVVEDTGEGLSVALEYNTDLFDATTIRRMLRHFQNLLEGVIVDPAQPIAELSLLTEAERWQLLSERNTTPAAYPEDACIHHLFEAQVNRTPDAVAVMCREGSVTYLQLNRRANQLTHGLQSLGVGPETCVGICMQRSIDMLIGVLAILKAGAAYVPLDPAYPLERLAFMISDSQVPVLLTQERLLESFPAHAARVICVDRDWGSMTRENRENPASSAVAGNPCYVIYTSGSTGQPKGVVVTHRSLVHSTWARLSYYRESVARFLLLSPFAFDSSVAGLFWTLCQGGILWVPNEQDQRDVQQLAVLIEVEQISHILCVPSLYAHLLAQAEPQQLRSLRTIIVAGEACPSELVALHLSRRPNAAFFNEYGPTEGTVWSTVYHYQDEQLRSPLPIGRPIANTQVYVLDAGRQPVPIGVPGELYIGGVGLARGYLNRPDLTAERFVPNPFLKDEGGRMKDEAGRLILHPSAFILYKTGDLARYLGDGKLEFLGRLDEQVKIRGYRIELGEIESVVGQHPAVRDAVVLAREDNRGEKRLIAYIVPQRKATLTIGEVRRFLLQRLPDYMVPAAFVLLDALPLTPNGKIDRRALPAPEQAGHDPKRASVAPRTPLEEALCGMWSAVLGVKQVGIHDNFFELGGHSLLATQIVSRIRAAFHVNLSVRSLFKLPTIAELAAHIEAVRRVEHDMQALPLQPISRDRELPLSFGQEWRFLVDQTNRDVQLRLISSAFRLTGPLNVDALTRSLNEIIRRHEVLRTTFIFSEERQAALIRPALILAMPVVNLGALPEAEREIEVVRYVTEEACRPFDRVNGPLLRATLLRLSAQEHVLLFVIEHIICDGWSMVVLWSELSMLYRAFSIGQPARLPELGIQFVDWAYWQRQWMQGKVLDELLVYWKEQLGVRGPLSLFDICALIEFALPVARRQPAVESYQGANLSLTVSPALTEAINGLCHREQVTLFTFLLAVLKAALYSCTGEDYISVFSSTANRTREETEALIGFFSHKLLLRTSLAGDPSFLALLNRVRQTTLEAYVHQDLPWPRLVEALQPEYYRCPHKLPGAYFDINRWAGGLELQDVVVRPLAIGPKLADPGFSLFATERGETIILNLWYNIDTYESATMIQFLQNYHALLASVVADPQQPLSDLVVSLAGEQSEDTADNAIHP